MKDIDIRDALKRRLRSCYANDPSTLIVDELGLRHGVVRVDVAVINGLIHGFELKSDRDTLRRLPCQMRVYNSVLDQITLVVGQRYVDIATSLIPEWWGIMLAERGESGHLDLTEIRKPQDNLFQDILAVAKLLWRDEALSLLEEIGKAEGVRWKRRAVIYERLAEVADPDLIRLRVRHQLRTRTNWRSVEQQTSDGD
ncbi:MAG: sce7726 family protein [Acidobacteriota bacterium]